MRVIGSPNLLATCANQNLPKLGDRTKWIAGTPAAVVIGASVCERSSRTHRSQVERPPGCRCCSLPERAERRPGTGFGSGVQALHADHPRVLAFRTQRALPDLRAYLR